MRRMARSVVVVAVVIATSIGVGVGQTATVIELRPTDTAAAKAAFDRYEAARIAFEQIRDDLSRKYGTAGGPVEFSRDFRFAVPALPPADHSTWPCSSVSLVPVGGDYPASALATSLGTNR